MSARDAKSLQADLLLSPEPATEPVQPSASLRAAVLHSLAAPAALAGYTRRMAQLFDLPEVRASELLAIAQRREDEAWVAAPIEITGKRDGTRLVHFAGGARVAAADCGLVSVEPGVRFAEHVHEGDEWSFVLAGAAQEEGTEATWLPGDLVHRAAGSRHAFRVTSAEPFVFAVVLEGAIRPTETHDAR
jgi:quercetin dioxygenase-like cupin family protein